MSKIAVSIGHTASGIDRGAISILDESICTREIGAKVKTYLEQMGHTVIFCRIDSASTVDESLNYKINKANNAGVDIFVEIHLNSGGGVGVETYAYSSGGQGEVYARKVQSALVELGYRNRGVKFANYKVLRDTHAPAILIECGFVDSKEDCARYNADNLAKKIVKGLVGVEPSVQLVQTPKPVVQTNTNNTGDDYMSKVYKNGSTPETVYADSNYTIKIGSLDPYETCSAIADVNGKIVVLYNTATGKKAGFVRYRAGL